MSLIPASHAPEKGRFKPEDMSQKTDLFITTTRENILV
jgi:hypothetical protein